MTDSMRIQANHNIKTQADLKRSNDQSIDQSFSETLNQKTSLLSLRFSNHAQKRLQVRDINIDDEGLNRLSQAVDKVEKRGGRESLVLMDDLAFIVNVKDRMVVTALDATERGEGVFTRIDSVVLADK